MQAARAAKRQRHSGLGFYAVAAVGAAHEIKMRGRAERVQHGARAGLVVHGRQSERETAPPQRVQHRVQIPNYRRVFMPREAGFQFAPLGAVQRRADRLAPQFKNFAVAAGSER